MNPSVNFHQIPAFAGIFRVARWPRKKPCKYWLCQAFAVSFLFLVQLADAEILTNGGFESGLTGWTTSLSSGGAATFANTTADIHGGTNALLVTVSNVGTASNSVRLVSSSFAASSADTYVLRFWASVSVLRSSLGVNLIGATPVYPQIPFEISTNENGYQEYLYAFRASGTISVAFNFQTVGQYWLDDIEMLDVTNNDGWDIPMTYLWQSGQLNASKTNVVGWGGADNGKSALLPDGSVAWLFNDTLTMVLTNTFYSNIRGDTSLPRNSLVHQVGTNLYWMNNVNSTFFVPTNPANLYWIGDSVVESNKLLVLLTEVNANAITNAGIAVATVSLPRLSLDSIVEIPSPARDNYGSFVNGGDGYYYIYNGPRVARTPVGSLAVSSAWNYWNGAGWVTNHALAVGLTNLDDPWSTIRLGVSNFATVFMPDLSLDIMAQFAPTPMGPWSDPVLVATTEGQWGEIYYAANICAGTGGNGIYTIGYSDDGSPEGLFKWVSDRSFYNPHFVTANLFNLSPYSISNGVGGAGSRLSVKFAADKNNGYDAINPGSGAGILNTTNWYNFLGSGGAQSGVAAAPFYTVNGGTKFASGARLVFNWANEINSLNSAIQVDNNVALLDSFINVNNNGWYLSVTNLDPVFTNGYRLIFYYQGGSVGWGGRNYVRYYAGRTTNTTVLGTIKGDLFTTMTVNNGAFIEDLTPFVTNTNGETPGANYLVFTNLSGGAFDLLITNGNYGGVNALEIAANPFATACALGASTNGAPWGASVQLTNLVSPAPPNGENVLFLDGATVLGSGALSAGVAAWSTNTLAVGTHAITAVYGGDANFLASTSSVLPLVVGAPSPLVLTCTPIGRSTFQLAWNSVPQQSYQVLSCTNLASGGWITNTVLQASGATTSVLVSASAARQEFFRISALY